MHFLIRLINYQIIEGYIPLEDIFGYADDLLILYDSLETLQDCVATIDKWAKENHLVINKSKSAIVEFLNRKSKKSLLKLNESFSGFPIIDKYKYLGSWFNRKLTLNTQLECIKKKSNFIRSRLTPALLNTSLDFRKSIWQLLILPLYELGIPIYNAENAKLNRESFKISLRNSFRSFTGLNKNVEVGLLNELMGYNVDQRSEKLSFIAKQKWIYRTQGYLYDANNKMVREKWPTPMNRCRNIPQSLVKYVNLQANLRPFCQPFKRKCNAEHLMEVHQIKIQPTTTILDQISLWNKCNAKNKIQYNLYIMGTDGTEIFCPQ